MEWNTFPSLRRLYISKLTFGRTFSLPSTLVELRFHKCIIGSDCDLVRLNELNPILPELRSLILSETDMRIHTVRKFLAATPSLELMHINGCLSGVINQRPVGLNFGSFLNLVELDVSRTALLRDSSFPGLIIGLTNLKVLKLSHTQITRDTVKMFADHREMNDNYPSLDHLYVEGCEGVSLDSAMYAEDRGIEVHKSTYMHTEQ